MKPDNLKHAIQSLALSPEQQIAMFPDFVVVADELALDYDDAYRFLSQELKETKYAEINKIFEGMSGNSENWTTEALSSSSCWEHVREIAREIANEEGWPIEAPPRDHVTYVKG